MLSEACVCVCLCLPQQQQQQQQQIHSQVILPSTITATTSHQRQVPNIHRTNNLVGQKMIPCKSSLLISMQINHHNTLGW